MTARPVVDGLQQEYAGRLRIVRVDLLTDAGRALAARYEFSFTPFFVGIDARGSIVWKQTGRSPTREQLNQLLQ